MKKENMKKKKKALAGKIGKNRKPKNENIVQTDKKISERVTFFLLLEFAWCIQNFKYSNMSFHHVTWAWESDFCQN